MDQAFFSYLDADKRPRATAGWEAGELIRRESAEELAKGTSLL
jgi:hypothetical protein